MGPPKSPYRTKKKLKFTAGTHVLAQLDTDEPTDWKPAYVEEAFPELGEYSIKFTGELNHKTKRKAKYVKAFAVIAPPPSKPSKKRKANGHATPPAPSPPAPAPPKAAKHPV